MPAVSSRQTGSAPPAPPGRTAAVRVPTVARVAGPSRIPAWVPVGDPSRFFSNPAVRETDQQRSLRETLIRPRAREAAAPPAGGLDARRIAPCGRSRCVFPDPTGRGPQRIGSRQHRRPERVRRAATPLAERTRAMEGSTRQPSDFESTAGRRAWDPDGFDGPPHSCPVSRWRWRAVVPSAGQSPAGRRWRRERKSSVEHRLRAGVALSNVPVVLGTVEVADAEAPGGGGPAPEAVVSSGRLAVWLDVHAESSWVFTTGSASRSR